MAFSGNWTALDNKSNALATATKAAAEGVTHIITGITATASGTVATAALLQVKDGTTVVYEAYVSTAGFQHAFNPPYEATPGNAVSAELGACGSGITGRITLEGYSR